MNYKKIVFILCFICMPQITRCENVTDESPEEVSPVDESTQTELNTSQENQAVEPIQTEEEDDEEDIFGDLSDSNPIVERPLWQQRLQYIGATVLIKALETQEYIGTKYNQFKKWLLPKNKKAKKKKKQ